MSTESRLAMPCPGCDVNIYWLGYHALQAGGGGGRPSGRRRGLFGWVRDTVNDARTTAAGPKTKTKPDDKKKPDAEPGDTKNDGAPDAPPVQPVPVPDEPKGRPMTRDAAPTEDPSSGLHKEDSSLQAWGRRLHVYPDAMREGHAQSKKNTTVVREMANQMSKLATQAGTDMPAATSLQADIDSNAKALAALAAEYEALDSRYAAIKTDAETLPGKYLREHETDEDRFNAPRNGRQAEKRADVSAAERDA